MSISNIFNRSMYTNCRAAFIRINLGCARCLAHAMQAFGMAFFTGVLGYTLTLRGVAII